MIAAAILLAAAAPDPISGTWEGTSLCQVKPSPCHDEHVVYEIRLTAAQHYRLDAYKIVAGRKLFMGPVDLTLDPKLHELRGPLGRGARGSIQLALRSNHLSGMLMLADGTFYRLIEMTKH
jgi:hypothetical protein